MKYFKLYHFGIILIILIPIMGWFLLKSFPFSDNKIAPMLVEQHPLEISEEDQLKLSEGLVVRDGDRLRFMMQSGGFLVLKNHVMCGDIVCPKEWYISYFYQGWERQGGYYKIQILQPNQQDFALTYQESQPQILDPRSLSPRLLENRPPANKNIHLLDPDIRRWHQDIIQQRAKREKNVMRDFASFVSRQEQKLSILLFNHQRLMIEDEILCGTYSCPPYIWHFTELRGLSPDQKYWIIILYDYDDQRYFLMDRENGEVLSQESNPLISSKK
jgi:hypothetical protein